MSESEFPCGDAVDLTNSEPERATASDAEKPSPAKPTEAAVVKSLHHQEEPDLDIERKSTENDYDDSHSDKSFDLNFASKLIDFKFSDSERPQTSPAVDSDSHEQAAHQDESKLTCKNCNKSFRYAATLARHEKVHLLESITDFPSRASRADEAAEFCEVRKEVDEEMEKEEQKGAAESEEVGSAMDSGSEEEKSDEEGGATEPKSCEGEIRSIGGKTDKRKKICSVCSKRFWSLQDLTRHMRSHTGEKCRTFPDDKLVGEEAKFA